MESVEWMEFVSFFESYIFDFKQFCDQKVSYDWFDHFWNHVYNLFYLQIDDQISLLINAWCELLVFSCCYRSIETPGIIRVSNEKSLNLETARSIGIDKWIEKMLNFTEQLRRLKVDHYEYVSMKVIVLLTSGRYRSAAFFSVLINKIQIY